MKATKKTTAQKRKKPTSFKSQMTRLGIGTGAVVMLLGVTLALKAAPPDAMNVYLGNTHAHTGAENDHGADASTAYDNLLAAKNAGYKFMLLTEHSGPTGPQSPAQFYADAQSTALSLSEDEKFIGMVGYEYSENSKDGDTDTGHMTGFGTTDYVNAAAPGMKFSTFYNVLANDSAAGNRVFAGFNHPDKVGHKGSATTLLTAENRKNIVMSETSRNPGYNATNEANYYAGYIVHLDRGWRVAPTCGMDSHGLTTLKYVETSSRKPCRTGVLAPSLTRDNLISAIQARRMYATRDTNMQIKYSVNDQWMGSIVGQPTTAQFDINVSDPNTTTSSDKIKKIEIIGKGGVIVASKTFDAHSVSWQPTVTVGTNKYLFVRVFNGERTQHTAVAAPVWFEAQQ